jgi:hypothetical protein
MNLKHVPPTGRMRVLARMSQGLRLVPDCCALCAKFPCLKEHTEIRESGDLSIDIRGCTKYQFVPCADTAGFPMEYVPKARYVPRFEGIVWQEPRRLLHV